MKILAVVLAVVFLLIGIGYAAGWLQMFVSNTEGTHHLKHAILFWVLAFLALIWYRFQSAPRVSR